MIKLVFSVLASVSIVGIMNSFVNILTNQPTQIESESILEMIQGKGGALIFSVISLYICIRFILRIMKSKDEVTKDYIDHLKRENEELKKDR